MANRRALVTGSARGTGAQVASRLSESGFEVIGVDVLEQEIGTVDLAIQADLGNPDDCARVLDQVREVDVLVNAHGLLEPRSIDEVTVKDFDRAMSVNLRSVFLLCQGLAPGMGAKGWGRIVNFSSVVARTGGKTSAPYAASKAGVIAITKSFASVFARQGVTCNAVAPAAIDTQLNAFLDDTARQAIIDAIPIGRFSTSEEFAALVMYLVSEESGFITGATIDMNGGWVMA